MNIFPKLLTLFIIAITTFGLINTISSDFVHDSIKKIQAVLASTKTIFENVNEIRMKMNPNKVFIELSQLLGNLGSSTMIFSAVQSFATVIQLKELKIELKTIILDFSSINFRLNIISLDIGNLENIIELSSARVAYVKTVTSINNNFKALEEAQKENTKEGYGLFAKQYENSFEFATENIYDAMTGSTGPFGFNMVNLYKTHVKCNPVYLGQFCIGGIQLMKKGLAIEGAYYGYLNLTAKAEVKAESWKVKIDGLSKQCGALIESCENSWKDYAYQQFRDTHREIGGDNQQFSQKLATDLTKVVPQRSWLTVVHNDAKEFEQFSYSTNYETEKIWDQKDHDVTIFSTPRIIELTGDDSMKFRDLINEQKDKILNTNDCGASRYINNTSKSLVEIIREKYAGGVVYIVQSVFKPGHSLTGNNYSFSEITWKCDNNIYRILIFQ